MKIKDETRKAERLSLRVLRAIKNNPGKDALELARLGAARPCERFRVFNLAGFIEWRGEGWYLTSKGESYLAQLEERSRA